MNVSTVLKSKGRDVATVSPDQSLQEIAKQLATRKIGAVVVSEGERLVGIISERDVVRAVAASGPDVLATPVADLMTRGVVTCGEETSIDELMSIMTKGRFRHVPVVEDDRIVGIVSIGDIVKNHIAEVEMEVVAMRGYLATG